MLLYILIGVVSFLVGVLFGVRNPKTVAFFKLISKRKVRQIAEEIKRAF